MVVLSDEKLVAQLDCKDSTDGDKAILNKIAKVDGVVQTNIIAVVRPVKLNKRPLLRSAEGASRSRGHPSRRPRAAASSG